MARFMRQIGLTVAVLVLIGAAERARGDLTIVDIPGITEVRGLNNLGQFVGTYSNIHGFVSDGVSVSTFDAPGAIRTLAAGINDSGQVVGSYETSGQPIFGVSPIHGYEMNGSTFTTFDGPGALSTIASGINNLGIITGYYYTGTMLHNFVGTPTSMTSFDVPGVSLGA